MEPVQPRRKPSTHIGSVSPRLPSASGDRDSEFYEVEERPNLPIATPDPTGILKPRSRTKSGAEKFPATKLAPNEEDWMHLTTNGFVNLLQIINSYWTMTENQGMS